MTTNELRNVTPRGCEVVLDWTPLTYCGKRATYRYKAQGGGYMHLCDEHAERHLPYAEAIGEGQ